MLENLNIISFVVLIYKIFKSWKHKEFGLYLHIWNIEIIISSNKTKVLKVL